MLRIAVLCVFIVSSYADTALYRCQNYCMFYMLFDISSSSHYGCCGFHQVLFVNKGLLQLIHLVIIIPGKVSGPGRNASS